MVRVSLPTRPTRSAAGRPRRTVRPVPAMPAVLAALDAAAFARAQDGLILDGPTRAAVPSRLRVLLTCAPLTFDLALDHALRDAAHRALSHGWDAAELVEFAGPRVDATTVAYLADVLGLAAQWSAAAGWLTRLDALGHRPWWTSADPHAAQWARRHGVDRATHAAVAVDVLALLEHLPRTHAARPGTPDSSGAAAGVLLRETRIAAKIDALFARTIGTTFTDEAEACAVKAQELLLRYSRPVVAGVGTVTRAGIPHRARPRPRPRPAAALTA